MSAKKKADKADTLTSDVVETSTPETTTSTKSGKASKPTEKRDYRTGHPIPSKPSKR